MRMNPKSIFFSVLLSALPLNFLLTAPATAQQIDIKTSYGQNFKPKEAGDFLIRVRGIGIFPSEEGDLSVGGASVSGDVEIDDDYLPEINFSYFITDNIALELIAATSKHSVEAKGTPLGDADLGEVRLLPPILSLQYHFLPDKRFSPYLGAGINHTFFFDVEEGDADKVEYEDSFGFSLQAGLDYAIADRWSLNLDVKRVFLGTDVDVSIGGVDIDADVDIDPWIFGIGIGYRF